MGKSKKIQTHAADVRVKLTAETLPDLFQLSLQSLNQLLFSDFPRHKYASPIAKTIHLNAKDATSLLIDFVSEALTLSLTNKAVFWDFKISKMTDHQLSGTFEGMTVDMFYEGIKAMIYQGDKMKINESGNWETVIIFDEL